MSLFFVFLQMLFSCKKYAKKLGEIPCGNGAKAKVTSGGLKRLLVGNRLLPPINTCYVHSIPAGKLSLVFQQLGIQIPFGNGEMFVV